MIDMRPTMDETLQKLLDQIPERPPRSKLEPHADVIRELRRKRRTYQEIAAFFKEHLQVSVAPSTIHEFVKVRARRVPKRTPELPELSVSRGPEVQLGMSAEAVPNPDAHAIRPPFPSDREKPSAPPPEEMPFQFDVNEPFPFSQKSREK
ncbi:MAG: hypothetical protein M3Y72_03615 [Acidobacteriota bacterium]|nr:hypothetical protein [Acidobacteriota bacterium]